MPKIISKMAVQWLNLTYLERDLKCSVGGKKKLTNKLYFFVIIKWLSSQCEIKMDHIYVLSLISFLIFISWCYCNSSVFVFIMLNQNVTACSLFTFSMSLRQKYSEQPIVLTSCQIAVQTFKLAFCYNAPKSNQFPRIPTDKIKFCPALFLIDYHGSI